MWRMRLTKLADATKMLRVKRQLAYAGATLAVILAGCEDSKRPSASVRDPNEKVNEQVADSATLTPEPRVPAQSNADALLPTYEVVDRDTYDAPIKTQVVLHAVVSGALTEVGVKQLLQSLYDECSATQGFKYNRGKPTHVFVYLYTSRDHFKSGMGQWVAMLSKVGEYSRVDTEIRTELIAQLDAKPEIKHGLSESRRKEIFRAIVAAEDHAEVDVERMYPFPDFLDPGYSKASANAQIKKHGEALNAIRERYRAEVATRYGVTEEQLRDVRIEAIEENWPLPEKQ